MVIKSNGNKYIFENYSVKFEIKNLWITGKWKGENTSLKILCGYSVLTKGFVYQDTIKLYNNDSYKNAGIVIEKPDFYRNYTFYTIT